MTMGQEHEFEGRTVEEAVAKAIKKLAVSKDRLDIKVICEESRGLFGMQGAKLAKIMVRMR